MPSEKTRLGITIKKEEKPNEVVTSMNKKRKSDEIDNKDLCTLKLHKSEVIIRKNVSHLISRVLFWKHHNK